MLKRFTVVFSMILAGIGSGQDQPAQIRAEETRALLKEGDIVSVNVFDEPSLSGSFAVGAEGAIVYPLLGNLKAGGRSTAGLAQEIEVLLEKDFIRDAQVAVALAEEAELPPDTVTVIGQVTSPGPVTFEAGTQIDLFTAIASAGGLAERGNRNRIELKRREGSRLKTQYLSLDGDRVLNLTKGDTLIVHAVPEAKPVVKKMANITVIGEVKSPGTIEMDPDAPFDIITAIAMAGGFTDLARPSKVMVRRLFGDGVKTYELNVSRMQRDQTAPFLLAPSDTITVTESIF